MARKSEQRRAIELGRRTQSRSWKESRKGERGAAGVRAELDAVLWGVGGWADADVARRAAGRGVVWRRVGGEWVRTLDAGWSESRRYRRQPAEIPAAIEVRRELPTNRPGIRCAGYNPGARLPSGRGRAETAFQQRILALVRGPESVRLVGGERESYRLFWVAACDPWHQLQALAERLAERLATKACGKFGTVSATSKDEAKAAARAHILERGAAWIDALGGRVSWSRWLAFARDVRYGAARLARCSIQSDFAGGQTGKTNGLREIRRAAVETLDALFRGANELDLYGVAHVPPSDGPIRDWCAVWQRVEASLQSKLLKLDADAIAKAKAAKTPRLARLVWVSTEGVKSRLIGQATNLHSVLDSLQRGESLELACHLCGWELDARGRCRPLRRALDAFLG